MKELLKKYREFEKWFKEDAEYYDTSKVSVLKAVFYSKGRYDLASQIVFDLSKKISEERHGKALREIEDYMFRIRDRHNLTVDEVLIPIDRIVEEALYPPNRMPYKTVMKESEFYGEVGEEDRIINVFMDFRKSEALLEVRSTDGKLIETERVEPRKFGYLMEGFIAAVGGGATWIIQSREGETKMTITEKEEYEYVVSAGDETFSTTDETEVFKFIDAKLEGIRTVCCDCTEGCRKCEWRGFLTEEIGEVKA